jgi:hypothetical protein
MSRLIDARMIPEAVGTVNERKHPTLRLGSPLRGYAANRDRLALRTEDPVYGGSRARNACLYPLPVHALREGLTAPALNPSRAIPSA